MKKVFGLGGDGCFIVGFYVFYIFVKIVVLVRGLRKLGRWVVGFCGLRCSINIVGIVVVTLGILGFFF